MMIMMCILLYNGGEWATCLQIASLGRLVGGAKYLCAFSKASIGCKLSPPPPPSPAPSQTSEAALGLFGYCIGQA